MIYLIPSPQEIFWSRQLNQILSKAFPCEAEFNYRSYLSSKEESHLIHAQLIKNLRRKNDVEGLFFVNLLEDFSFDYIKLFPKAKIFGYLHGSNILSSEPGRNIRGIDCEEAIYGICDRILIASNYFNDKLVKIFPGIDQKLRVVGFPFDFKIKSPKQTAVKKIIYNHRLDKNKNPLKFLELTDKLKDFEFYLCTPSSNPFLIGRLKKNERLDIFVRPEPEKYFQIMDDCDFQVSFANSETFGTASMYAILRGLFALCPKRTGYLEFAPEEMLYNSDEELIEKIKFFNKNISLRNRIISRTQEDLKKRFYFKNWIKNLDGWLTKR